jgi:1-acyl-sn-glycerol-3-phosphate acyltransferase
MTRPRKAEPVPTPADGAPVRRRRASAASATGARTPAKAAAPTPKAAKVATSTPKATTPAPKAAKAAKAAATPAPVTARAKESANGHRPAPAVTVAAMATPPADQRPDPAVNGHRGGRSAAPAADADQGPADPDVWSERVADLLAFLRRRLTGRYEVDEFGFDAELTDTVFYPLLRLLYRHYFRVDVLGAQHLPAEGPVLLVANHSGTVPVDALMLALAVHDETPTNRHMRLLGADLVFRTPVLSEVARKSGATLACNPDAERLLRTGEVVGVFPEGFKGIGKHYRDRYKLQRFGRGGFVSAALRTATPIVPVSIVGAEEIYPIIGSVSPVAKIFGLPYFPVTPLFPWFGPLGLLPLPSKWLIEFGEPISTAGQAEDADDPVVVFNLADQVRETIQQTLYALLERRPDPFG